MGRPRKDELKMELRVRNGVTYAYTSTSEFVDGKKVTRTTYVGKWDPVTQSILPKKPRGKYRSREEVEEQKKEMTIKDIVDGLESREYGSVYLLDLIQRRSRLGRDLWVSFGDAGRGILGTAMALCLHRGSFMDVEDTMARTMIGQFYGLKGSYSSQSLSEFTHSIGLSTANIDIFFGHRIKACEDVVSWDSTTIGTWAGDNGLADYVSNNKDDESIPQVKKAIASDGRGVPLMYELYPGSMSDMATLKDFIDRTRRYGAKEVIYVMDRGYESGAGISYLDSLGAKYVIPARIQGTTLKSLLTDFKKPVKEVRFFEGHSYDVWETRIGLVESRRKLTDGSNAWDFIRLDGRDGDITVPEGTVMVKAFVCFDTASHSDEIQNFRNMLRSISDRLDKVDCEDPMSEFKRIAGKAARYFDAVEDGRKLKYSIRQNAKSFKENRAGTFMMLTSPDIDWNTMMTSYNARRLVEQNFDTDKSLYGRFGTKDPVTIQGREFIRFISLILRCELTSLLRDSGRNDTVDSVLNSMAAIVAMGRGEEWFVKNLCKKHRELFKALKLDPPSEVLTNQRVCSPEESDSEE